MTKREWSVNGMGVALTHMTRRTEKEARKYITPMLPAPRPLSQDTLPSPLAIGCLTKYYSSHCATSDVYGTPVTAAVNTTIDRVGCAPSRRGTDGGAVDDRARARRSRTKRCVSKCAHPHSALGSTDYSPHSPPSDGGLHPALLSRLGSARGWAHGDIHRPSRAGRAGCADRSLR